MTTFPANHPAYPDLLAHLNLTIEAYIGPDTGWVPCPMVGGHAAFLLHADLPKRLPLGDWLGRAQLARVLAAGLKCDECGGKGAHGSPETWDLGSQCGLCSGTGYLRTPSDVRHLLPVAEMGALPMAYAQHAPALLKAHAEGVAGGGVGIVGILDIDRYGVRNRILPALCHNALTVRAPFSGLGGPALTAARKRAGRNLPPWRWTVATSTGDIDGEAPDKTTATRDAEAAALAHGMALLQPDGTVVLPHA